ncbi:hypothetical protein D9613_009421 [Agrocybe pediades]|uniref:DUF6535 domain-containing protein n=1 Tax=Agrocybe pediades TaxID=84607 RepID=A0A8H4VVT3_9AGAR|nr:hypothetical protein D9613_009421 [Agrocybe pediades]
MDEKPGDDETWQVGDRFRYPLPRDGKHWETLLDPLMERDRMQCAAWKEEVQNLVIFAGLFSSVLSAFVVQTYQSLQPDPNNQVVFLLSQIANNMGSSPSNTSFTTASSFTPDSSSVRINVLWLISLVLSLTTVLIAIVASQWLTEHQHYPSSMSLMEKYALFHMRQESLAKWRVPEILSSVPLLLLLALILFFVGLIDFAATFVRAVAIPVIISACIPLVFIALTTSLPMFQILSLSLSTVHATTSIPAQCSYKSTQSRVLQRIMTSSSTVFLVLLAPMLLLWSIPRYIGRLLGRPMKYVYFRGIPFFLIKNSDNANRRGYKQLYKFWKADSWFAFDERWMQFRSTYMMSIEGHGGLHWAWFSGGGAMYDCSNGILKARDRLNSNGYNERTAIALYHSVDDLLEEYTGGLRTGNNFLFQKLLYSPEELDQALYSLAYDDSDNQALRKEETLYIFFSRIEWVNPYGVVQNHFLELYLRLLNYSISRARITKDSGQPLVRLPFYLQVPPDDPSGYFIRGPVSSKAAIRVQYSKVVEAMFRHITDEGYAEEYLLDHSLAMIQDMLGYTLAHLQSSKSTGPIFDFLSEQIETYAGNPDTLGIRSDLFFFNAAVYAKISWRARLDETCRSRLASTLRGYIRERGTFDSQISSKLQVPLPPLPDEVPADPDSWWFFCFDLRGQDVEVKEHGNEEDHTGRPSSSASYSGFEHTARAKTPSIPIPKAPSLQRRSVVSGSTSSVDRVERPLSASAHAETPLIHDAPSLQRRSIDSRPTSSVDRVELPPPQIEHPAMDDIV